MLVVRRQTEVSKVKGTLVELAATFDPDFHHQNSFFSPELAPRSLGLAPDLPVSVLLALVISRSEEKDSVKPKRPSSPPPPPPPPPSSSSLTMTQVSIPFPTLSPQSQPDCAIDLSARRPLSSSLPSGGPPPRVRAVGSRNPRSSRSSLVHRAGTDVKTLVPRRRHHIPRAAEDALL